MDQSTDPAGVSVVQAAPAPTPAESPRGGDNDEFFLPKVVSQSVPVPGKPGQVSQVYVQAAPTPAPTPSEKPSKLAQMLAEKSREGSTAPPTSAAPTSQPAAAPTPTTPAPAAAAVSPQSINPGLIELAEILGMPAAEARSFGSNADLERTLKFVAARQRAAAAPAQQPGQQPGQAPAQPPAPAFDWNVFEGDDYDAPIKGLAKMVQQLVAGFGQVNQLLPHLARHAQAQQVSEGRQNLLSAVTELGLGEQFKDPTRQSQLVRDVVGLRDMYVARKDAVPELKALVQRAIAINPELAALKPATNGTAARDHRPKAPDPNDPARATQRVVRGTNDRGGKLRALMIDKGYDPGETESTEDEEFFRKIPQR